MRRLTSLLAMLLPLACATPGERSSPSPEPGAALPELPSDFTAYRKAFGARVDYSDLCERDRPTQELALELAASYWEAAERRAKPWLIQCPVDAHLHMWRAGALYELGREPEAEVHNLWFRGLIESVLASGDGRTPETAYVTISVAEEYAVLAALGLQSRGQTLVGEPAVDAITVENQNGARTTVYFNPAAHFERLMRQLGE